MRQVLLTGVEEPNLWLDVAETFETGLAAILAHTSQVDPETSRSGCASGRAWSESRRGSASRRPSCRSCSNDAARRRTAAAVAGLAVAPSRT